MSVNKSRSAGYSGIFNDEKVLQLKRVMRHSVESTMTSLSDIVKQAATGNVAVLAAWQAGLGAIRDWKTKVLMQEVAACQALFPEGNDLLKYTFLKYVKETYKGDLEYRLKLTYPPFRTFYHRVLILIANTPEVRATTYMSMSSADRDALIVDAIRDALMDLSKTFVHRLPLEDDVCQSIVLSPRKVPARTPRETPSVQVPADLTIRTPSVATIAVPLVAVVPEPKELPASSSSAVVQSDPPAQATPVTVRVPDVSLPEVAVLATPAPVSEALSSITADAVDVATNKIEPVTVQVISPAQVPVSPIHPVVLMAQSDRVLAACTPAASFEVSLRESGVPAAAAASAASKGPPPSGMRPRPTPRQPPPATITRIITPGTIRISSKPEAPVGVTPQVSASTEAPLEVANKVASVRIVDMGGEHTPVVVAANLQPLPQPVQYASVQVDDEEEDEEAE